MLLEPAQRHAGRYLNPVPTSVGGLSIMFKVGRRFFLEGRARSPNGPLGPFHTDPRIYATWPRSGLRITWIGHATAILEIDGVRILVDPMRDKRASPTSWIGPKRFFPPPLELSDLPSIDAVIVSHDHYDHLGAGTIRVMAGLAAVERARWIVPLGGGALLRRLGVPAAHCLELNWMDSTRVGPIEVTALPARHFSGRSLFKRFATLWASFGLAGPQHRVYCGADSGEWEGFREIGRSTWPCSKLALTIHCGRRFTWDRKARCAAFALWATTVC